MMQKRSHTLWPSGSLAATLGALAATALVATAMLIAPPTAMAGATVPGSQYSVSFNGTAREQVATEWGKGESSEQQGSWGVEDSPLRMWLPAVADPEEELGGNEYGFTGGGMAGVPRPEEPPR